MKQLWVVVLLLLPAVYATNNITTSETTIAIEGSTALVETSMLLNSDSIANLTLILTPNFEDFEITIDGKETTCLLQAEFARCGNLSEGLHEVNISYETDYPIAKVGENTLFRYVDKLPYLAEKQQITLKLPVGYIIPREKDKDESFYISPKPKDVYSDGQRIILNWEQPGQELSISAVARQVIGPPLGWMAATALSFILAAAISIWFVLGKPKTIKQKPVKKKLPIIPSLIDKEQQVVNFLKETGEVWQKQIQQATGFSKAKVSRIVRNLEERGVVTKTIYGNTNKIALKQK